MNAIGVIGLGAMGMPMASNIVRAFPDLTVGVTARGQSPRLMEILAAGAVWHDSPASLAQGADLIVLVLPDLPEVESVVWGKSGIMAGHSDGELLVAICSTSSPTGIRSLDSRLRKETEGRVRVVDAPLTGGEDGARAGTLSILMGGDDTDVAAAAQVLSACGRPVHLGPLGAGETGKACNQLVVASTILALAEAGVLAVRSGLDLTQLFDAMAGGYAGSRILETRGARVAAEDYTPSGIARYMMKDLRFATDLADATGTRTVLLPALTKAFDDLVARGLGDMDIAVVRKYIEDLAPHQDSSKSTSTAQGA
jgi:2-hydroxy-3-oxopropionate reductase